MGVGWGVVYFITQYNRKNKRKWFVILVTNDLQNLCSHTDLNVYILQVETQAKPLSEHLQTE